MSVPSYTTPSVRIGLSWSPIQTAEQLGPGCHLTAAVQPQQNNFGHFEPILICKSDTWKASSVYPHSMCSLARRGSVGVLLCLSLGVTLVSHLPPWGMQLQGNWQGWQEGQCWEPASPPLCFPKITDPELVS